MDHCKASEYAQGLLLGLHISTLVFVFTKLRATFSCARCTNDERIQNLVLENEELEAEIVRLTEEVDVLRMQNERAQNTIRVLTNLEEEGSEDQSEKSE